MAAMAGLGMGLYLVVEMADKRKGMDGAW